MRGYSMIHRYMVLSFVALVSYGLNGMESTPKSSKVTTVFTRLAPKKLRMKKKQSDQEAHFKKRAALLVEGVKSGHNRSASLRSFADKQLEHEQKLHISEPGVFSLSNSKQEFDIKEQSDFAKEISKKRVKNFINSNTQEKSVAIVNFENDNNRRLNKDTVGQDVNRFTKEQQENYKAGLQMVRAYAKEVNKKHKK